MKKQPARVAVHIRFLCCPQRLRAHDNRHLPPSKVRGHCRTGMQIMRMRGRLANDRYVLPFNGLR